MKKIQVAEPDLSGNEKKYLLDALLKEGRISAGGKYVDKFENIAKRVFRRKYGLSCSNGTSALHLALLALELGPADEVIVPVLTFAATAAVVRYCGAKPVFVDVKLDDWTLDIGQLNKKLTPKTKALIAVDLYGMPCDYDELEKWCSKNKIMLIEDAAEAHGARYKNQPIGSFGKISCFSFYGNKVLTTGEGGLCLTDDAKLYKAMKVYRNHGMKKGGIYEHDVVGYNYRMTNLQAAVGCAQFERFNTFLKKRDKISSLYKKYLSQNNNFSFQKYDAAKKQPICWLFSLLSQTDPNKLRKKLFDQGIDTRPFLRPMHLQKAYREFCDGEKFPNADIIYRHGLTLPTSVKMIENDIKRICVVLNED